MLTVFAATIASCLSLSAVDGDTNKCNGQNMPIMGPGKPFESGVAWGWAQSVRSPVAARHRTAAQPSAKAHECLPGCL